MLIPPARATMVLPPSMGGQEALRRPSPRPGTSAPRDGPKGRGRPAFERAGSLFARKIDTICDGRLQGLAAVRQIGRGADGQLVLCLDDGSTLAFASVQHRDEALTLLGNLLLSSDSGAQLLSS